MHLSKKQTLFLGYIAIIYAMFLLLNLVSDYCGREVEHWRFFYAFTQQSNILVMLWLFLLGIDCFHTLPRPLHKIIQNQVIITALAVYISITFFIVAFVLNPVFSGAWDPLSSSSEFLHHNLTPIIMWLYFFLIKGEGGLKLRNALLILIYPIIYVGANLLIGANVHYLSGEAAYAYNFINPNKYTNVFIYICVILGLILIFSIFGVLLIKLKKYVEKATAEKN